MIPLRSTERVWSPTPVTISLIAINVAVFLFQAGIHHLPPLVVAADEVRGFNMSPSALISQDLAEIWLAPKK